MQKNADFNKMVDSKEVVDKKVKATEVKTPEPPPAPAPAPAPRRRGTLSDGGKVG